MFSIITVVYNDLCNLKTTYDSVRKQTFKDYEHLIIDGGSTDGTVEYLNEIKKKDRHLRFLSGKDRGIYDAMNKGVSIAKEDYVLFLNAGDTLYSDTILEEVNELLCDRPDVLYGKCEYSSGEKKGRTIGGRLCFFDIVLDKYVAHQSVFAKREILLNYPFDLIFKYQADQVFMFQAKKHHCRLRYVNKTIAFYDGTGVTSQASAIPEMRHERYATLKKYCPLAYIIRQTYFFIATGKILDLSRYETPQ